MNRQLRVASLVLVLGLSLGFGYWQQQGWAAGQAGSGLKKASNKLKQPFSPAGARKTFSSAPATAPAAPLATITVMSLGDGTADAANCPGANCRLRDAIAAAVDGDTIDFAVTGTINLGGELVVAKDLTINGPGATQLTISGQARTRVFRFPKIPVGGSFRTSTVALSGLRIANGLASGASPNNYGGGIYSEFSTLTITNCAIDNNRANTGAGILVDESTVNFINSTLSGNIATSNGGAVDSNIGTVNLINSTLAGNSANWGGAFYGFGILRIVNSTLTGNSATQNGGAIYWSNSGAPDVRDTIIAGNTAGDDGPDVSVRLNSQGYNLIGNNSGVTITPTTGDQIGTAASPIDPRLGPLANNGGPTQTCALLPGSPALDAGAAATNPWTGQAVTTDQRGGPRPVELQSAPNASGGNASDIGAYEVQHDTPLLTINPASLPDAPVGSPYDRTLSASDGSGNYSFSISSGIFPWGLTLSATGQISGTPITGSLYSFTVKATDKNVLDVYGLRSYTIKTTSACVAAPSGLVDWWRAEGNAQDSVGSNHATLNGSATFSTVAEGQVGRTFKFDGANGYVALPDNLFPFPASGTGTTPFSFELWFKSAASGGVILGQQDVAPYNTVASFVPAIYVGTDGKLRVEMFWKGAANPLASAGTVNDNLFFHHLAVTYNGTQQIVYLDGQVMGSQAHTQTAYNASYKYQLGTGVANGWPGGDTPNGGWFNFNGLIDEPSLYNRALTAQEVQALFAAGNAGKCTSCSAINATVAGGGAICSGGSATVTIALSGGVAPYTVTLSNGGGTKTGSSPLSFSVSPATTTTYTVQVASDASGCPVGASGSATVTVNTAPSLTTQPTDQTVAPSGTASFTAAANGSPTPTVQWQVSTNGGASFSDINGATNTTLTLNNVNASQNGNRYRAKFTNTCGMATSNAAILTVNSSSLVINSVSPPAGRVTGGQAVKLSGSLANLSSVTVGGVTATWSYTNGTSEVTVTTPAHAAGAVNIVLTPTSGGPYTKTNAFAYLPTSFTDNTLTVGVTTAKAQHILELRQAVDALRAVAGSGPATWVDATLSPGSTLIKAVHITELRTNLENVATLLGYSAGSYTDPGLSSGLAIKRVHIEDLRQRIRTLAG